MEAKSGCHYPKYLKHDNNKANYVPSSLSVPLNDLQLNLTDMAEIDSIIYRAKPCQSAQTASSERAQCVSGMAHPVERSI